MTISVASYKGGCGKTTTSIHLAAYLAKHAGATLLVDADPNRQSTFWASFGKLPFPVASELEAVRMASQFEHLVFDTKARVERQEVDSINRASDLIIIPCPPDTLAAHAALQMTAALAGMGSSKYRVLITMVPHDSYREQCESMLKEKGVPYFRACIRRLVAFQKAAAAGQLVQEVTEDDRAGAAWEGYKDLGKEIDRLYFRHDGKAKGRKEVIA
jgi:chromosome partitioning protein